MKILNHREHRGHRERHRKNFVFISVHSVFSVVKEFGEVPA
jgi:hypothetical protein